MPSVVRTSFQQGVSKPSAVPGRTRLERELDLTRLAPLARKEGSSKKPVYQMHKWWARRLGVNFRYLILGAMMESRGREETLWKQFFDSDTKHSLTVLDPFMGGGTSIVEATKLGARTIGVDLDPMAWFIVNHQVASFDEESFLKSYASVDKAVRQRIQKYYQTRVDGRPADVVNYFWVEIIPCSSCGHEFEGHINYLLYSKKKNHGPGPRRMGFCRSCYEPNGLKRNQKRFTCHSCGVKTKIDSVPVKLGKYKCPRCDHSAHISQLSNDVLPLNHKLFALEYIDPVTETRAYKKAEQFDLNLYDKATRQLRRNEDKLPIPDALIPIHGRSDARPVSLGYKRYRDLFNDRQLLTLGHLLKAILAVTDSKHRELLLLAFSDSLACNNRFCSYAFGYQKLTPLFGLHAFRRIARPVEGNVWGTSLGRGSFSSCVRKVLRGKQFARSPFEYRYGKGGRPIRVPGSLNAHATIAPSVKELANLDSQSSFLAIGDSRKLDWIPPKSVDLVLTDPPYYDNLAYLELADFYYVWLRNHVEWTKATELGKAPMEASLFVRSTEDEEHQRYAQGLLEAFRGCRRALKDDGLMVFTYHHANQLAWNALASALRDADLRVTNCFPMLAEGSSGFHSDHGNIKWDVVFVCRPGRDAHSRLFRPGPAKTWLDTRLNKWSRIAEETGAIFGEADRRSLAFGLTSSYLTLCEDREGIVAEVLFKLEQQFPFKRYERRAFQVD